jgi:hypothetical protein
LGESFGNKKRKASPPGWWSGALLKGLTSPRDAAAVLKEEEKKTSVTLDLSVAPEGSVTAIGALPLKFVAGRVDFFLGVAQLLEGQCYGFCGVGGVVIVSANRIHK